MNLLELKQQFWKLSTVLFKGASQNVTLALYCNLPKNLKKFSTILGSRTLSNHGCDATYLLRTLYFVLPFASYAHKRTLPGLTGFLYLYMFWYIELYCLCQQKVHDGTKSFQKDFFLNLCKRIFASNIQKIDEKFNSSTF